MTHSCKPSRFNILHHGKNGAFLYNVFSGGLLFLENEHIAHMERVLADPPQFSSFSAEEQEMLLDNGFFIGSAVDELDMVKFRYRKSAFDKSRLVLTLLPTKACNLACGYCFEHQKNKARMSEGDIQEILRFIESELREIRPLEMMMFWYGGEPLLAVDVIAALGRGVDGLCRELNIRREKDALITNGYLLDEATARRLHEIGIGSVQITLDGNPHDHNLRRVLPGGGATFDRIYEAIGVARRVFGKVGVRINTNKANLPGIKEMLAGDPLFHDPMVQISVGPLRTYLGGAMSFGEDSDCFRGRELMAARAEIDRLLGRRDDSESSEALYSSFLRGNNCGADQFKNFVIGPGALVYKCYEKVDPGEEVGFLRDGRFVPRHNYWKWAVNEPFEHEACRSCLYLPLCMGGCPASRKRLGLPNDETCGYWEEWVKNKLQRIDQRQSTD